MPSSIPQRLEAIRDSLPEGVTLVAVSKFHAPDKILEAYNAGQRVFGESRVQELLAKIPQLPDDIQWHFIGHLQTNKVRQIMGLCRLVESVDSTRLLDLIDKESERAGTVTRVLLQVHVAAEETKTGFMPDELIQFFTDRKFENLRATHICGIMGMATNTDNTDRITEDFTAIRMVFDTIRKIAPDLRGFDVVSMGMSDDHTVAIECGSTMVRIGTDIFGPREY